MLVNTLNQSFWPQSQIKLFQTQKSKRPPMQTAPHLVEFKQFHTSQSVSRGQSTEVLFTLVPDSSTLLQIVHSQHRMRFYDKDSVFLKSIDYSYPSARLQFVNDFIILDSVNHNLISVLTYQVRPIAITQNFVTESRWVLASVASFPKIGLFCLCFEGRGLNQYLFYNLQFEKVYEAQFKEQSATIRPQIKKLNDFGKIYVRSYTSQDKFNRRMAIIEVDGLNRTTKEIPFYKLRPLRNINFKYLWEYIPGHYIFKAANFENTEGFLREKSGRFRIQKFDSSNTHWPETIEVASTKWTGSTIINTVQETQSGSTVIKIKVYDITEKTQVCKPITFKTLPNQLKSYQMASRLCGNGLLLTLTCEYQDSVKSWDVVWVKLTNLRKFMHLLDKAQKFELDAREIQAVLQCIDHDT